MQIHILVILEFDNGVILDYLELTIIVIDIVILDLLDFILEKDILELCEIEFEDELFT